MLTLTDLFLAAQLGVLAYVITCVLTREGYLLEWYYDMLVELEQGSASGAWLSKPLGLCERCFCGQGALWVWFYLNYETYTADPALALLRHGSFIALAIVCVTITKSVLNKCK